MLLTAGMSSGGLSSAAKRIATTAKSLFEFEEILVLNSDSLGTYCPDVQSRFGPFLNDSVRGFGYWAWKSEFVFRALRGEYGNFDQVVWLDAGCEVNSNFVSRKIFKGRIKKTSKLGYWFHALDNSDLEYSKKFVIKQYPKLLEYDLAMPQIQANYFHLQGEVGSRVAGEWFRKTIESIENINLENIIEEENDQFIEHRSDQSILSLICKSLSLNYMKLNIPSGRSTKSVIKGLHEPIWISRNRTGISILPYFLKKMH